MLEVRKKLSKNGLIKAWLSFYNEPNRLHELEDVLSRIEIEPIGQINWLRTEFKEEIEDIKLMENYTKLSAIAIKTTGLYYHWSFLNS